ncbi:hypothetical protein D9M68_347150 [compost metagenome]
MPPPRMNLSTLYLRRFDPPLSTSMTSGRRFSRAISWQRISFWLPGSVIAPASIPESLTTTMQRTPLTKPMPAIWLPPGIEVSGSGSSTQ